jgi:hypothetical protein
MLEQIWTNILDFTAQLVTPDWGKLINLMPVAIVLAAVLILMWTFRRLAGAKPARRGKGRVAPRTPAGLHMPGPSFAPVFGALGVFLLLLGLVFGGISVVLGLIALVLTLLYWLAEGLRVYDHDIGPTVTALPAPAREGPPAGVHMPGPSWRPFVGALGLFALLLGLVFGGWLLGAGVIVLIATLFGWLVDAVNEYRRTVAADRTGHIENGPAPGTPSRLLAAFLVLILVGAVFQSGALVTGSASGETGSGSPAPGGSGAPPASGATGSGGPPAASGGAADVTIEAKGVAFVQTTFSAPASKPFTIAFDNEDAGTPHDIEIRDASGKTAFMGEVFPGVATKVYQVPALPAGSYTFICVVHPTAMSGTATLQ